MALAGHTKSNGGGVFDRLAEVVPGDAVDVVAGGRTWRYRVTDVRLVAVDRFDSIASDVYRVAGPSVLTVMTCGDFDGGAYRSTVIVRAEPPSTGDTP